MFYRPEDGHGLPHNPLTAIIQPRPIGWISTRGPRRATTSLPIPSSTPWPTAAAGDVRLDRAQRQRDEHCRSHRRFCREHCGLCPVAQAMNQSPPAAIPPTPTNSPWPGWSRAECATIPCPRVADAPPRSNAASPDPHAQGPRQFPDPRRSHRRSPTRRLPEGRSFRRREVPADRAEWVPELHRG
jgi:hypothetical protein